MIYIYFRCLYIYIHTYHVFFNSDLYDVFLMCLYIYIDIMFFFIDSDSYDVFFLMGCLLDFQRPRLNTHDSNVFF